MDNEINTNQVRSMENLLDDFLERAHNYIGQAESSDDVADELEESTDELNRIVECAEQQRDDYLEHADKMLEQVERILTALDKADRLDPEMEDKHAQVRVGARLLRSVCETRAR
jgi:DNA repair ATPase RecN